METDHLNLPPASPSVWPPEPPRRHARWWVRVVRTYLALLLVNFVIFRAGGVNHIVIRPTTQHEDPMGAEVRHVAFGAGQLCVFAARSPGCRHGEPQVFDLELIGNGSRAEGIAEPVAMRWGERRVEVWTLNYPGYGDSTGPASLEAIPASAIATYDALATVAAGRPILLGSHSLGTTVALYLAHQRPVAGMVLLNPPPLKQLILGHYGWWNLWVGALPVSLCIPNQLNSLQNARLDHVPAVFVSSDHDRTIPPPYHRRVFDAYAGPKRWLSISGGHNAFPDPVTINGYALSVDWLWSLLPQTGVPTSMPIR